MRTWYAVATVVALLTVVTPAWASFPGENGRIVFQSNRAGGPEELYTMNADATDIRRLTWNTVADRLPRFSPDGSRIVFTRAVAGNDHDIWIMNADGSGERRLTSGPERDEAPVFTRDGKQVVFQRVAAPQICPCELRIVGADGEGERLARHRSRQRGEPGRVDERQAGVRGRPRRDPQHLRRRSPGRPRQARHRRSGGVRRLPAALVATRERSRLHSERRREPPEPRHLHRPQERHWPPALDEQPACRGVPPVVAGRRADPLQRPRRRPAVRWPAAHD